MALMVFTGARNEDMITFGKQHVKNGVLRYVPKKTDYLRLTTSEKPILPILADIIAKSPTADLTFLVNDYGRPFTEKGIGNKFRERCNAAKLPQCTAHGLKKAGATVAAENGATERQLMALFDWTSVSQATVYTKEGGQEAAGNRCCESDGWDVPGT